MDTTTRYNPDEMMPDAIRVRRLMAEREQLLAELAEARQQCAELAARREDDRREWTAREEWLVSTSRNAVETRDILHREASDLRAHYLELQVIVSRFFHAGLVYLQELSARGEYEWTEKDRHESTMLLALLGPPK